MPWTLAAVPTCTGAISDLGRPSAAWRAAVSALVEMVQAGAGAGDLVYLARGLARADTEPDVPMRAQSATDPPGSGYGTSPRCSPTRR